MRKLLLLLVACSLAPCLGASSAWAEPPPPSPDEPAPPDPQQELAAKAAALAQKGAELHAQGLNDQASVALKASWMIEKKPATAALLGDCEVKLERWTAAAEHLRFALRDQEEGPERERLEALFKKVLTRVASVRIVTKIEDADVFAGDRLVGQTPLADEVFVDPGTVEISLKRRDLGELRQVVQVALGGTATARLEAERAPVGPKKDLESRSRIPVYAFTGVGVVGIGAALGFTLAAASQGAQAADALSKLTTPTSARPCSSPVDSSRAAGCQSIKDQLARHDAFVNAGTGLFVVGGAALAAGVVYALWPAPSGVSVAPTISPSAGGLLVQGAF